MFCTIRLSSCNCEAELLQHFVLGYINFDCIAINAGVWIELLYQQLGTVGYG